MLSLGKLYVRSIWHTLTGGSGGLNLWRLEDDSGASLVLFFSPTLQKIADCIQVLQKRGGDARELDGNSDEGTAEKMDQTDEGVVDDDDGPWYLGKAREEFYKRQRAPAVPKPREEDDDPIQVCSHAFPLNTVE